MFVFEASCPLSGLDLVRACHVFQSDKQFKEKKIPQTKTPVFTSRVSLMV